MGDCTFAEYSQRAGCGDRMLSVFKDFLRQTDPLIPVQSLRLVLVALYEIFQAVAIGLSVFIYVRTKAEEKRTGAQVICSDITANKPLFDGEQQLNVRLK